MNEDCKTVLVIEDEESVREVIRDVLEIQGFTVVTAADGELALQYLNTASRLPCVILLDLMMPNVNGWQFLDKQRTDPRISKIPVIICSAYKESAAAIHPSAIINKPLQRKTLLQTVETYCA